MPRTIFRTVIIVLLTLALGFSAACKSAEQRGKKGKKNKELYPYTRDWNQYPAIPERTTTNEVIAFGDVHGGYDRLVALLTKNGLIQADAQAKGGYAWTGGNRIVVCTGDLIDKGSQAMQVIDLLMALEGQIKATGGELIVTLGNHEATFLANPGAKKADEFEAELQAKDIDPVSLSRGASPYGVWLMNRAYAARVNDWFFSHSGNTSGKTIEQLSAEFKTAVEQGDWKALLGETSLLESEKWWKGAGDARTLLDRNLAAVKAKHLVFGHDPGAFEPKGNIDEDKEGRLVLIDTGMSPAVNYSKGALLRIETIGNETIATSVDADGNKREIWRGK